MNEPRVSVVLPYRDAAATLDECLDSIAAQTLAAHEVVAVDDGSTDGSAEIVRGRAGRDPRLRPATSEGRGIVAALNTGIAEARCGIVARMDADDRMHPERLALQSAFLEDQPDIVLVACRARMFPRELAGAGMDAYLEWQDRCISPADIAREIYVEAPFVHPTVMFRRDAVQALGGYRDGPFPEDYELWLRLHAAGCRMAKVDSVLLEWRQSPSSLSRTDPRYDRAAFDTVRARYLCEDPRLSTARPLAIWGAGRRTRKRVAHLAARGIGPDVFIDIDTKKIGNRIGGVPVHSPEWLRQRGNESCAKPFVLGYVASRGAREEIAAALGSMGYLAGVDFLMVG